MLLLLKCACAGGLHIWELLTPITDFSLLTPWKLQHVLCNDRWGTEHRLWFTGWEGCHWYLDIFDPKSSFYVPHQDARHRLFFHVVSACLLIFFSDLSLPFSVPGNYLYFLYEQNKFPSWLDLRPWNGYCYWNPGKEIGLGDGGYYWGTHLITDAKMRVWRGARGKGGSTQNTIISRCVLLSAVL